MNTYNTIIFDLDGTLLNTLEDLADAVNYVMQQYEYPTHTIETIRGFVGNGIRNLMVRATPDGEDNPMFEEGYALFKQYYLKHSMDKTKPYEGIMELLLELKKRQIKMAVVSNKNQKAVEKLVEHFFGDVITVAVGDNEIRKRKPARDSVDEAIRQLAKKEIQDNNISMNMNNNEQKIKALYVGDSDVDYHTAKNAGLDCVLVSWGFREKELLQKFLVKGIIDKPGDLVQYM